MNLRRASGNGNLLGALPMTSMIDVVFLLLIFFLVTSDFSADENRLAATIASQGSGARASDLQPQVVTVQMAGGNPVFRIGERVARDRSALTAILSQLPKEQGVAVRVRDDVPIHAAATAMQAAFDAGFTKRTYVPASGR